MACWCWVLSIYSAGPSVLWECLYSCVCKMTQAVAGVSQPGIPCKQSELLCGYLGWRHVPLCSVKCVGARIKCMGQASSCLSSCPKPFTPDQHGQHIVAQIYICHDGHWQLILVTLGQCNKVGCHTSHNLNCATRTSQHDNVCCASVLALP